MADYLKRVNAYLLLSKFGRCADTWGISDFTPAYSKFYFICSGEGWLKIGDSEYYPKPGELYLIPEGAKHSYSTINRNTFTKYYCHFNVSVGHTNLFDLVKIPHFIRLKHPEAVQKLFDKLLNHIETDRASKQLHIQALLLELLAGYFDEAAEHELRLVHNGPAEMLNTVLGYIHDHLAEDLSVNMLAGLIHLHPVYFCKYFKRHIRESPKTYINMKRLEKAKHLLETTALTISDISEHTGYSNVYYFSNTFKAHFGLSPSEYRNHSHV